MERIRYDIFISLVSWYGRFTWGPKCDPVILPPHFGWQW